MVRCQPVRAVFTLPCHRCVTRRPLLFPFHFAFFAYAFCRSPMPFIKKNGMETLTTRKVSIVLWHIMEAKERILEKAHDLFNRYGIRSVSMDDIAAQLGMSKKTLYQYYVDKDELVNAVFDASLIICKQQCLDSASKCENAIHEVFLSFDIVEAIISNMNSSLLFDMEKYHPSAYRKFQEFRQRFLYKMIKDNIESGIQEGLYREDLDVEVMVRFRLYSILLAFNPEIFPSGKTSPVYIEQQLLEHFLYGVVSPKGLKLIQKYKSQRTKKIS
jgi:TetR/AcrR family transcriptional regulator, cholesterol catabolism regulator